MHQQLIIVIPPIASSVPMCLADAEIAAAIGYAEQEKSEGTRPAYGSDWRAFSAFCDARGLEAMPAAPGTAARLLSLQADSGLKASTSGRRAAAIAYFHKHSKSLRCSRAHFWSMIRTILSLSSILVPKRSGRVLFSRRRNGHTRKNTALCSIPAST